MKNDTSPRQAMAWRSAVCCDVDRWQTSEAMEVVTNVRKNRSKSEKSGIVSDSLVDADAMSTGHENVYHHSENKKASPRRFLKKPSRRLVFRRGLSISGMVFLF